MIRKARRSHAVQHRRPRAATASDAPPPITRSDTAYPRRPSPAPGSPPSRPPASRSAAAGIRQQSQRRASRHAALFRHLPQSRPAHGNQRDFRRGEEAVQRDDRGQQNQSQRHLRRYNRGLQSSACFQHAAPPGDQSEHSGFADRACCRPRTGTRGVRWPKTSGEISAPISARGHHFARRAGRSAHSRPRSWKTRCSCKASSPRRIACGRWMRCAAWPRANWPKWSDSRRSNPIAKRAACAWRRIAEASRANPAARAIARVLAAYARGVNFYLETHRGHLPLEFTLLNYDPRPWTHSRFAAGRPAHVSHAHHQLARRNATSCTCSKKAIAPRSIFLFPPRTGSEIQPGSNAWAISGAHTATGKPILANDPHLEFSIPSHLAHGPSARARPERDRRLAARRSGRDHRPQRPHRVGRDQSAVRRAGSVSRTDRHANRPLCFSRAQWSRRVWSAAPSPSKARSRCDSISGSRATARCFSTDEDQHYSLRWAAAEPSAIQFPVSRSRPRAQLGRIHRRPRSASPVPAQNFVYADVDGNIGYHATGRLPIRPPDAAAMFRPTAPRATANGRDSSLSTICRSFYNPAAQHDRHRQSESVSRRIITYPVAGDFAAPYRSSEIRTLLERAAALEAGATCSPCKKMSIPRSRRFPREADRRRLGRAKAGQRRVREAVDLLRDWNGQMEKGTRRADGGRR